ncbi:hypothetical protein MUG91_G9n82 [Manis pentadactyla]|nr:hypothetical protein MUG91_G9n82 [Manis pentadactyla]
MTMWGYLDTREQRIKKNEIRNPNKGTHSLDPGGLFLTPLCPCWLASPPSARLSLRFAASAPPSVPLRGIPLICLEPRDADLWTFPCV